MSSDSRPDEPRRTPEEQRSRRIAAWVTFSVVLVLGLAVAVVNPVRDWYSCEPDPLSYVIPFVLAGGLSWAAYRGGGKGVLIAILAIVLALGLTCTALLNNMDWTGGSSRC